MRCRQLVRVSISDDPVKTGSYPHVPLPPVFDTSGQRPVAEFSLADSEEGTFELVKPTRVRSNFPESWIWQEHVVG